MNWRGVIGISVLCALLFPTKASAVQYAYQVTFTDKNNTPYSLSYPAAYLSPRSISRRAAQNIAVDSTDLPVNTVYTDSIVALTGGKIHGVSRWLNSCVILVSDSTSMHALDGKSFIASRKLVGYYATTLHMGAAPLNLNNRTFRTTSLGSTYYGNTWQQTMMVNGNTLHENEHRGAGKLIAVLDAGFLNTDSHPGFDSMRNSGRLVDWYNFTLDTTHIYAYDDHGSKALSTMAGLVPSTYIGSAPMASYALYVSEDGHSEQPIELLNMMSASERADSVGADIITTSLGYNTFDNPSDDFVFAIDLDGKSTVAAKAANIATQKGILFVASAGNEGASTWHMVLTPGDADSALTVGSVDGAGNNAANSGFGPNAAGKVKPDVCGMGQPASIFLGANNFGTENGTSFSTPQIAGWAACLWHAKPSATPYEVKQAIIRCASHYSNPGTQIGYGIPDFYCTQIVLATVDPAYSGGAHIVDITPNPFFEQLYIRLGQGTNEPVSVNLIDVAGRVISSVTLDKNAGAQSAFIPTSDLAAGMYLLRASSSSQQEVVKVIKQH